MKLNPNINKEYYALNRDKEIYRSHIRAKEDPNRHAEQSRQWYANHQDERRAKAQEYYRNNKDAAIDRACLRRKHVKQALAKWADISKIAAIYCEARRLSKKTGIEHHVDHIIPLRSKFVCGLHVENNLQIITAEDNLKKSNRLQRFPGSF